MKFNNIILIAGLFMLAACSDKPETKEEHGHATETHAETNIVGVTDIQMKTAGIAVGTVEMKNLTSSISVNGTLAVPNQNKALITSLANGVVRSLNIQPGDFVRKGQVIGSIANTEISGIQQQLISIRSQIDYSEKDLKRQREMVDGNAAPLKNLQRVESELNGLRAQRNAIERQLTALGISASDNISSTLNITSPISGTVSEITAQIGSNVDASTPIASIINNSELHLDLFVYEKDLPKVAAGQVIHFTLTNNPGKEYDAKIYSIGTAFMNETKAIPIHAAVINDKSGLIEGMGVTARISIGEQLYPAVPDEAIVSSEGKDYVFVLIDAKAEEHDNQEKEEERKHADGESEEHAHEEMISFERIEVIRGVSDVGYTEIKPIQDIPGGTKIAVTGAFFLMAKMTNTGGHEH